MVHSEHSSTRKWGKLFPKNVLVSWGVMLRGLRPRWGVVGVILPPSDGITVGSAKRRPNKNVHNIFRISNLNESYFSSIFIITDDVLFCRAKIKGLA